MSSRALTLALLLAWPTPPPIPAGVPPFSHHNYKPHLPDCALMPAILSNDPNDLTLQSGCGMGTGAVSTLLQLGPEPTNLPLSRPSTSFMLVQPQTNVIAILCGEGVADGWFQLDRPIMYVNLRHGGSVKVDRETGAVAFLSEKVEACP